MPLFLARTLFFLALNSSDCTPVIVPHPQIAVIATRTKLIRVNTAKTLFEHISTQMYICNVFIVFCWISSKEYSSQKRKNCNIKFTLTLPLWACSIILTQLPSTRVHRRKVLSLPPVTSVSRSNSNKHVTWLVWPTNRNKSSPDSLSQTSTAPSSPPEQNLKMETLNKPTDN